MKTGPVYGNSSINPKRKITLKSKNPQEIPVSFEINIFFLPKDFHIAAKKINLSKFEFGDSLENDSESESRFFFGQLKKVGSVELFTQAETFEGK